MIPIKKSETADTRTRDFTKVTEKTLLFSSVQHIGDVRQAIEFFVGKMLEASRNHDTDKLTDIGRFHADFITGFKQTGWWDRHRLVNRHHLTQADGIPEDVNLIDVLDFIADCVMAGMARSGKVTPIALPPELLEKAFGNTIKLLMSQVYVDDGVDPNEPRNPKVV